MKILKLFFILSVLLLIGSCSESLDDIINRNISARGGKENISSITTLFSDVKAKAANYDLNYKIYIEFPDKFRFDMNLLNTNYSTIINNNQAWIIDDSVARVIPPEQIQSINGEIKQLMLYFLPPVFDYKKKNIKVENLGHDTVNKQKVVKIKLTFPDMTEITEYLDIQTYLELKSHYKKNISGSSAEFDVFFSNYRKVNNITIPFSIEVKEGESVLSKIGINSVDINSRFKPTTFKPSKPLAAFEEKGF